MPIDADHFRAVLGRFATGVAIVTIRDHEGRDHGMTVSAFSSLSLDPPLVLVCIGADAAMSAVMHTAESFSVNILSADQEASVDGLPARWMIASSISPVRAVRWATRCWTARWDGWSVASSPVIRREIM